jgi:hypothetical protein
VVVSALATTTDRCGRCQGLVERGDLRCPVCAFTVPHEGAAHAHEALKVFRCSGCGAATSWSAEKKAIACAFCGAATALEEIEDPVEQTETWVPFAVDGAAARLAFRRWLKSLGFFRPSDLAASSTIDNLKPLWWPAWIFDARARATWAADSNAGSGRSAWAPHAGETELAFERIVVGASRGLSEKEMAAMASAYDLAPATSSPARGPDVVEEAFDVQRSAARERVAEACQGVAVERIKNGHIPGRTYRKISVSLVLSELLTRRVALPAWILAYTYKGKLYRVVVHGQDAGRVLGTAPWSAWKILGAVAAGIAALSIVGVALWLLQRR